jgi:hypothetical protein
MPSDSAVCPFELFPTLRLPFGSSWLQCARASSALNPHHTPRSFHTDFPPTPRIRGCDGMSEIHLCPMLRPEQGLSERVEQLFILRYTGPDACPHGYEEADGEEYVSTASVSSGCIIFLGQRVLLRYRWTEDRLFNLYHRCGRYPYRSSARMQLCLTRNAGCSRSHCAEHSGWTHLTVQGSCTLAR